MENLFVWDSSVGHAFVCCHAAGESFQLFKRFEKKAFALDFPVFFQGIAPSFAPKSDSRVFLGAGPGSFTGIKTGISFIAGYLYARGVTKVQLVSSLDILSLFVPYYEDTLYFVVSPFNMAECFVSIFKWEDGRRCYLEQDRFIRVADLATLCRRFNYDTVLLVSGEGLPAHLGEVFTGIFRTVHRFQPNGEFHFRLLHTLPVLRSVDMRSDPFILNYVASPADLGGEHKSFYIAMN